MCIRDRLIVDQLNDEKIKLLYDLLRDESANELFLQECREKYELLYFRGLELKNILRNAQKMCIRDRYLSLVCKAVCRSKRCCGQCSMGPCHGNRNSIRNPGSDCSSSACTRNWKSLAQCIQEDGYRNRTCRSGKINIIQNIICLLYTSRCV